MWAVVFAHYARETLPKGVTTLRIPGAHHGVDLVVRRALDEGYGVGPRLVCAGEAIGMTGGHQGAFGGACVDGPWACAQMARRQFEALGPTSSKSWPAAGSARRARGEMPTHAQLTVEEMAAVVDVAHSRDKRVTAHADGERGISNALEAGLDCLEHGIYLTEDHARYMAEHGVMLVPTLECHARHRPTAVTSSGSSPAGSMSPTRSWMSIAGRSKPRWTPGSCTRPGPTATATW